MTRPSDRELPDDVGGMGTASRDGVTPFPPLTGPAHPAGEIDTAEMPALDLSPPTPAVRPTPCLEVTDLAVDPFFRGMSFTAGRGELVAVVGDAGTGRTSLLLSIAGRFRFHRGRVAVEGRSDSGHVRRRVAVARAGVAVRPDPEHTVGRLMAETVLAGCPASVDDIRTVARMLGVTVDTGEIFGRLPAVDQTLLAIAFAAAERTPLLVVDDVDAGLGNTAAACVWAALRVLADNDHVVVATSLRPDLSPDVIVRVGQSQARVATVGHHFDTAVLAVTTRRSPNDESVYEEPI
ncbi:MAG TPA: ATP-binding cassette domain-containing protein [Candidatus Stackebrandtia excrementipullorum]|nr:ATP-binding cassette domain-containing protein [Candidatus Stackebrandtia excrementipullorum]